MSSRQTKTNDKGGSKQQAAACIEKQHTYIHSSSSSSSSSTSSSIRIRIQSPRQKRRVQEFVLGLGFRV